MNDSTEHDNGPILFYFVTDEFGAFSNFYRRPVLIDGLEWPTTEHYFQAMAFPHHPEIREEIRCAAKPMKTKHLANEKYADLVDRTWWHGVRDAVMLEAVRAKFTQHEDLKELLLSTGEKEIVEHTDRDSYWADGGDGSGENKLGKILMAVRDEL